MKIDTTFDALSNELANFLFERMVLRIWHYACAHSLHSCVMTSSLFVDFSSQSKYYLDMEYSEIGLMSLMLLFSHNQRLKILSTEPY